jgi:hypothetical protein
VELGGEGADRRRDRDQRGVSLCSCASAWVVATATLWMETASAGAAGNAVWPLLVPAVIETSPAGPPPKRRRRRTGKVHQVSGMIEMEIDGVSVRIGGGADARTVAVVIRALKATRDGLAGGVRVMVATRPVDFPGPIIRR